MREAIAKDKLALKKYTIGVLTGSVKGAGTDANVFINLFGTKVRANNQSLPLPPSLRSLLSTL